MKEKKGKKDRKDSPFLSIGQMAEYLGMGYKPVWTLVNKGELPAIRIGGVYRIRKEDAQRFLESKMKAGNVTEDVTADTQPDLPPAEVHGSRFRVNCARCLQIIRTPEMVGGECEEPFCDGILCRSCWSNENDRYCIDHKRNSKDKYDEAMKRLEAGEVTVIVEADRAHFREWRFISGFDQLIRNLKNFRSPVDGRKIKVSSWENIHQEYHEEKLKDSYRKLDRDTAGPFPLNKWSIYDVGKDLGKGSGGFVIAAYAFSHLTTYHEDGFDVNPVGRGELLWLLQGVSEQARQQHCLYIIGIASTTGWDIEAQDCISGEGNERSFSDLNVATCLVDLEKQKVIRNTNDPRLKDFVHLYRGDTEAEVLDNAVKFVLASLKERDTLLLSEFIQKYGIEKKVGEQVFKEFDSNENYTVTKMGKGEMAIVRNT